MDRVPERRRTGFTLIELLVVMAVIAVFLGVIGLAVSSSGGAMGTQAAQRTVTTMISAARSQAISSQSKVRLIIHADPPAAGDMADPRREKFLRFMAMLVDGPNGWEELNDGTYLPKGTYVVPPWTLDAPAPTIGGNIISVSSSDWEHERRSIVEPQTMQYAYGDPTGAAPTNHYIFIEFDPRGTTEPTTEIGGREYERRIVLAPAKTTGSIPHFANNEDLNVLGGVIRRNGSFTLINDPEGFPEPLP